MFFLSLLLLQRIQGIEYSFFSQNLEKLSQMEEIDQKMIYKTFLTPRFLEVFQASETDPLLDTLYFRELIVEIFSQSIVFVHYIIKIKPSTVFSSRFMHFAFLKD